MHGQQGAPRTRRRPAGHRKVKVGYEIPISRHFYEYKPLRPLAVIEGEIRALEKEIQELLGEVLA